MKFNILAVSFSLLISSSLSYAGHSFDDQCTPDALTADPVKFNWTYTDLPEPHYVGTMEIAVADQ